jgi:aromatic-L-amino-acid/L-tryptophan decarboxylase
VTAPLQLDAEAMRRFGHAVVDSIVDHLTTLRDKPAARIASRESLEATLKRPFSDEGEPADDVLQEVVRHVLPFTVRVDHPRFFAFVPGPNNFVSVMADTLAAGYNVFAGHWFAASGPAEVELETLDFLRTMCGLPDGAGGIFVSGGSMANLTAIAAARHARLQGPNERAITYCSDQTHHSLTKALRVLGFRNDQARVVPSDGDYRLPMDALEAAIQEDRAAGRIPFCVVANAGTTNTGSVDPLEAIADLCEREGLWFHVDGAYGAAAALCPEHRATLGGMARADSITLDPHKWLFQPYEIGCTLVRDSRHLSRAFALHDADHASYLDDVERQDEREPSFYDRGVQLTRGFRALKLWMSLRVFGVAAFREAVRRGVALAEHAESRLASDPAWEVVSPANLGVVTFRFSAGGIEGEASDELQQRIVQAIVDDGFACVTSVTPRDRTLLRFCTIHPATTTDDIDETIRRLRAFGDSVLPLAVGGRD